MQPRMKNPAMILPDAMRALLALGKATEQGGVPFATHKLVQLRASQINGCSVCVDIHARELKAAGEADERIFAVAAWRDTPYFTVPERAALALAEAVTRIADRPDPVPDDLERSRAPLRRARTRRARRFDRADQSVEPAQRDGEASRWRRVVAELPPPTSFRKGRFIEPTGRRVPDHDSGPRAREQTLNPHQAGSPCRGTVCELN